MRQRNKGKWYSYVMLFGPSVLWSLRRFELPRVFELRCCYWWSVHRGPQCLPPQRKEFSRQAEVGLNQRQKFIKESKQSKQSTLGRNQSGWLERFKCFTQSLAWDFIHWLISWASYCPPLIPPLGGLLLDYCVCSGLSGHGHVFTEFVHMFTWGNFPLLV